MTKPQTVSINIPFPGFYHSWYSDAVDREESSWLEYHGSQDQGEEGIDYESAWPESLQIKDLRSILCDHSDYSAAYLTIARDYVAAFDYLAGEAFGLTRPAVRTRYDWTTTPARQVKERYAAPSIGLEFEGMVSPREYNFQTDRLFAKVPLKVMRELFKRSAAENHATFARVIRERFTSRSDFVSFYSNDVAEWLAKPLADYDHNEFGTLLIAGLELAGVDLESDSFRGELYESTLGDEGAYLAWSDCVAWPAFDTARGEAKADLFAEWLDEDPDGARAWLAGAESEFVDVLATAAPALLASLADGTPLSIRCPATLEMFPDTLARSPNP